MACMAWSSSPRHLGARDRFIGWTAEQRRAHIHLLAYNTRFLILPRVLTYSYTSSVVGCQSNPDCCSAGGTDDPAWTLAAAA